MRNALVLDYGNGKKYFFVCEKCMDDEPINDDPFPKDLTHKIYRSDQQAIDAGWRKTGCGLHRQVHDVWICKACSEN